MQLLLTNDDGVESVSLSALSRRLGTEHDVWTFAPESERSASSHSVTLREAIKVRKLGDKTYACSGTPADCVILAVLGMIDAKIDMVISGPNIGPNLGTDIIYSGTAAAARQAVLMGIPALAASLAGNHNDQSIEYAVEFVARNLPIFNELASSDHFLNINFPDVTNSEQKISITFPSLRIYRDELDTEIGLDNTIYCKIKGPPPESHVEHGSDYDAVASGMISISPIMIHPLNHQIESRYRNASIWSGKKT
jgi:5'-nucleotidase